MRQGKQQCPLTIIEDKTHRPIDRLKTPTIQFCYGKKINQSHLVRQNIVIVGDPLLEKLSRTCWNLVFGLIWLGLIVPLIWAPMGPETKWCTLQSAMSILYSLKLQWQTYLGFDIRNFMETAWRDVEQLLCSNIPWSWLWICDYNKRQWE